MHFYVFISLWAIAAYVVYSVASTVVAHFRNAARAKQLGCKPAPYHPETGFLGINTLRQFAAADAAKRFPDKLIERQEAMDAHTGRSCTTHETSILGDRVFVTCDPKNIQAILATQFKEFDLGTVRRQCMMPTLGDGIFVQDGAPWEHSRAMLRPNFVRDQVSDLELEEHHVQNLFKVMMPVGKDGWTEEVNIQAMFFRLTMDSACQFLFGKSTESQMAELEGKDDAQAVVFSKNFDSAQRLIAKKFRLGTNNWLYNPKAFRDSNKVVRDFIDYYVAIALKKSAATPEKAAEEGLTQDRYVFLEALAQQTRDPTELSAQLLNILLAGRDTTASLLSWLFHQLLRNPRVFAKLRAAILADFGPYTPVPDHSRITFASLKAATYLQHCLSETLRLWTVVPGNSRRATHGTSIPRGGGPEGLDPVYVPAGIEVQYSIHVMHRRKDLWGADADEFRPERFEGRRNGWEFLPFNGGPRICIGQQFALTEASYVVVRLLQRFAEVSARPEELEGVVQSDLGLTNCPGRMVKLRLREAKD